MVALFRSPWTVRYQLCRHCLHNPRRHTQADQCHDELTPQARLSNSLLDKSAIRASVDELVPNGRLGSADLV